MKKLTWEILGVTPATALCTRRIEGRSSPNGRDWHGRDRKDEESWKIDVWNHLKPRSNHGMSWWNMVNSMVNCSWTWRKMDEHGRQVEILQTSSDPVVSIRSKVSGGFAGHPPGLAENTPVIRGSHTRPSRLVQKWSTLKSSKNPPKILQKHINLSFPSFSSATCHLIHFAVLTKIPASEIWSSWTAIPSGKPQRRTIAGGQIISEPLRIVANMPRNLWDKFMKHGKSSGKKHGSGNSFPSFFTLPLPSSITLWERHCRNCPGNCPWHAAKLCQPPGSSTSNKSVHLLPWLYGILSPVSITLLSGYIHHLISF